MGLQTIARSLTKHVAKRSSTFVQKRQHSRKKPDKFPLYEEPSNPSKYPLTNVVQDPHSLNNWNLTRMVDSESVLRNTSLLLPLITFLAELTGKKVKLTDSGATLQDINGSMNTGTVAMHSAFVQPALLVDGKKTDYGSFIYQHMGSNLQELPLTLKTVFTVNSISAKTSFGSSSLNTSELRLENSVRRAYQEHIQLFGASLTDSTINKQLAISINQIISDRIISPENLETACGIILESNPGWSNHQLNDFNRFHNGSPKEALQMTLKNYQQMPDNIVQQCGYHLHATPQQLEAELDRNKSKIEKNFEQQSKSKPTKPENE